jgi:hypothetical protein
LGTEAGFGLRGGWLLDISGEYDLFWRGLHYNEYSDINPEAPDTEIIQNSGWGARGSIGVTRKLGRLYLAVAPFFRYWHIKSSEASDNFDMEPDNQTREWGTKLGVRF